MKTVQLKEIVGDFKALFVDVYGVLHDGGEAFPGALAALRQARSLGLPVVIVTNSAQRIDAVAERLGQSGIASDAYDHIISSGELACRHVEHLNRTAQRLPRLCVIRDGPSPRWVSPLPNVTTAVPEAADLLLVAGLAPRTEEDALASGIDTLLTAALRHGLPMIVADSDETYPYQGRIRIGPGWVARRYAKRGGETLDLGKPYAPIFKEAARLAGHPEPQTILMIGDNLKTDIAFARRMGLSSLLIHRHGVHRDLSIDELAHAAAQLGIVPDFVTPSFKL